MIDDKFSINNIEEAFQFLNDNSSDQEQIISFLNEWCEQPNSIFSALNLIQISNNPTSHFICSSLINNKITFYWNQLETDQKNQYRDSLISIIYSTADINDNSSYNLIHSLCKIAIFDWPDDFPSFSEIFNLNENTDENIVKIRILSSFLDEIDYTDLITDKYRNELRQLFIQNQHLDQIEFIIKNYISIEELSNDILAICDCVLRWFIDKEFMNIELFDQIIRLLSNEITNDNAVKCLNSFLLSNDDNNDETNNEDDHELNSTYSPYLVHFLSTSFSEDEKSVILSPSFSKFLVDFLAKYSYDFESLLTIDHFKDDGIEIQNYPKIFKLSIYLKENNIEKTTAKNDILILFNIILSISFDEIDEDLLISYLKLCEILFKRISNEKHTQLPVENDGFYFFIYNDIFQFVYNIQNFFEYNEGEIANQMNSLLNRMYSIDPEYYINFLKEQPPTPQLCWAIGSIDKDIDTSQQESFISILIDIIGNLESDQSPEFLSSLLYALSHWASCFNLDNRIFDMFNQLIFDALAKNDERLSYWASSSFFDVVAKNIKLYQNDCLHYIELITSNCCEYLSNLNEESSEKMLVSCTKLIRYYKHISKQPKNNELLQLYEKLFDPFIQIFDNIDEFPPETIKSSINIIGKVCILSKETATDLIEIIWPHLIQLAQNTIPDASIPQELIECILNTIAKIQVKFEYDDISPQIEDIFDLMIQRGRIEDCFFIYFAKLRIKFNNIDNIYERIHQQIVLPYISQEIAVSSEMFKMIEKFSWEVIDIEWFSENLIETIKNMSTDVVYTALNAFKFILQKTYSKDQKVFIVKNIVSDLIRAIIEAILDLLHKPLLLKFCEVIAEIVYIINNIKYNFGFSNYEEEEEEEIDIKELETIIKNSISSSLFDLVPEPQNGFFDSFTDYLLEHKSGSEIMENFSNLLIILKKATPCDLKIFVKEEDFSDDEDLLLDSLIDDVSVKNDDLL